MRLLNPPPERGAALSDRTMEQSLRMLERQKWSRLLNSQVHEIVSVAQATRLSCPATRRTERKERFQITKMVFSRCCVWEGRSVGRRPGEAGRLCHPS